MTVTTEARLLDHQDEKTHVGVRDSEGVLLRAAFRVLAILLAAAQAWAFRCYLTADSISYLDMSDGVLPGSSWHRLINGVWSPLYPLLLGVFRRAFHISPAREIVSAHLFNVVVFIFAQISFEVLLGQMIRAYEQSREGLIALPRWARWALGYSLFIWASISAISLQGLRPDMLMSGFVYLALALLIGMQGQPARWDRYLMLGITLGFGYLAKAPLLPLGVLIILLTVFIVKPWDRAAKMAVASLALCVLIGGAYFVPLSLARGRFTLGESGTFNYLVHVDQVSSSWYLPNSGIAEGSFVHPPRRLLSVPPAYAFPRDSRVTHPLRFDPSEWIVGVRPRFSFRSQVRVILVNAVQVRRSLWKLKGIIVGLILVACYSWGRTSLIRACLRTWPIWLIAVVACIMYLLVHVEPRYVGEFLVLPFIGFVCAFQMPAQLKPRIVAVVVIAVVFLTLAPVLRATSIAGLRSRGISNADAQAATELAALGIRPEDRVARITLFNQQLGVERILRTEIVAEIDYRDTQVFWTAPSETQHEVLKMFFREGAKAVIATPPESVDATKLGWKRLRETQYWVWLPSQN